MRALDWRGVLAEHHVPHIERGANVKRGELNIRCPFCGSADPSFHMGLSLETGYWACWRNSEHRGKSPLRLLCRLLNVSYSRARQIAGMADDMPADPDGFDAMAARIMGRDSRVERMEQVRREFLRMPATYLELCELGSVRRFFNYMLSRNFSHDDVYALSELYGLRAARTGPDRDRVILPYYMDGDLVAWTGRAIGPATIRYKDLPRDECIVPIKETLFNYDCMLRGGAVLFVVEGPLDALKIDLAGRNYGVRAAALSTNSISQDQIYILEEFAPSFDKVVFMLDTQTKLGVVASMHMKQKLAALPNLAIMPVPFNLKDAGEMSPHQVDTFVDEVLTRSEKDAIQPPLL